MMENRHKKIVIFIPKAGFRASYEMNFIESYIAAKDYLYARYDDLPFTFTISQYFSHTFPIDANRNECVSMAINNEIDLSIFLDTDHILPHDAIYKMVKHDLPIVAGVYYGKGEPHPPIIYKENKELSKDFDVFNSIYTIGDKTIYDSEELFEADMAGAGCFAVSLDVLKRLKKPYFKYRAFPDALIADEKKRGYSGNQKLDIELQDTLDKWESTTKFKVENEIHSVSEDVWFWKNVRENTNYKLIIDPTIQLPHGPIDVWVDPNYSKVFYNTRVSKEKDIDKCKVEPLKMSKNGQKQPVEG